MLSAEAVSEASAWRRRTTIDLMKICSVAHALPTRLVTNGDLVDMVMAKCRAGLTPAELAAIGVFFKDKLTQTGAATRYHRAEGETALELGCAAGNRALHSAGLDPESIDLLIYTGVGRGFIEPATANVFQRELRLSNATCFDILDACASWLRGIDVAHHLVGSGAYRRAMVLNSEANFSEYEPRQIGSREDLEGLWSAYTVGEAATATVVVAGESDAPYRTTFRNAGAHLSDCQIPLPHAAQFLNGLSPAGPEAMRFFARPDALARGAIRQLHQQYWGDPVMPSLDYDIVFGHSVSEPVSQAVLRRFKLDPTRYYEIFPAYGNVVSASLPLAMSLALADGRLQRGHRVLLVMGGAGLTTALSTFVY